LAKVIDAFEEVNSPRHRSRPRKAQRFLIQVRMERVRMGINIVKMSEDTMNARDFR